MAAWVPRAVILQKPGTKGQGKTLRDGKFLIRWETTRMILLIPACTSTKCPTYLSFCPKMLLIIPVWVNSSMRTNLSGSVEGSKKRDLGAESAWNKMDVLYQNLFKQNQHCQKLLKGLTGLPQLLGTSNSWAKALWKFKVSRKCQKWLFRQNNALWRRRRLNQFLIRVGKMVGHQLLRKNWGQESPWASGALQSISGA